MKPTNANSRVEAAATGRQDAGPTPKPADHLTAGFHSRDHLPHLKKEGGSYFVTFRLAGTLPANVLQKLKGANKLPARSWPNAVTWRARCSADSARVDALDADTATVPSPASHALRFFDDQRSRTLGAGRDANHVHVVELAASAETLTVCCWQILHVEGSEQAA
jgi:hypothetical protein